MKSDLKRQSWFEQNPKKTWLIIIIFGLFFSEIILRIIDPGILRFIYNFRKAYEYNGNGYMDLKPNIRTYVAIDKPFLNFVLTTNKYGFRDYDRPLDYYPSGSVDSILNDKETIIIHALGDSLTMGWGVDYSCSYPALLDSLLKKNYRVLNLGVDGFGAIAATEKSRALWQKFPAKYSLYLFCYNDFEDDLTVIERRGRSSLFHYLMETICYLRTRSYLFDIPFSIKWYLTYRNVNYNITTDRDYKGFKLHDNNDLIQPDYNNIEKDTNLTRKISEDKYKFTIQALTEYNNFVKNNGGKFIVLAEDSPNARILFRLCRAHNIDIKLFTMPGKQAYLRNEGHFSQLGNYLLARFIYKEIIKSGAKE